MTDRQRRKAARLIAQKWQDKGKEDEDDRSYWFDMRKAEEKKFAFM